MLERNKEWKVIGQPIIEVEAKKNNGYPYIFG